MKVELVASEILKTARRAARMTQAELANRAGTRQSAISAYENGRQEPTLPTLQRLLEASGHELSVVVRQPTSDPGQLPNTPLGRRLRDERLAIHGIVAAYGGSDPRVFGSVARGEDERGSDLDLLIAIQGPVGIFTIGRIAREVEKVLGVEVDVVPEESLSGETRDRILGEAIKI